MNNNGFKQAIKIYFDVTFINYFFTILPFLKEAGAARLGKNDRNHISTKTPAPSNQPVKINSRSQKGFDPLRLIKGIGRPLKNISPVLHQHFTFKFVK